jgi:hypothetical protein
MTFRSELPLLVLVVLSLDDEAAVLFVSEEPVLPHPINPTAMVAAITTASIALVFFIIVLLLLNFSFIL